MLKPFCCVAAVPEARYKRGGIAGAPCAWLTAPCRSTGDLHSSPGSLPARASASWWTENSMKMSCQQSRGLPHLPTVTVLPRSEKADLAFSWLFSPFILPAFWDLHQCWLPDNVMNFKSALILSIRTDVQFPVADPVGGNPHLIVGH